MRQAWKGGSGRWGFAGKDGCLLRSGYTEPRRAAYNKRRFAGGWSDADTQGKMKKNYCRACGYALPRGDAIHP